MHTFIEDKSGAVLYITSVGERGYFLAFMSYIGPGHLLTYFIEEGRSEGFF